MSDMLKGILIGVVVVKVVESETVQNYIHKVVRKKCHEFGTKVADAIFPVEDEKEDSSDDAKKDHGRYPWGPDVEVMYDKNGAPHMVRRVKA